MDKAKRSERIRNKVVDRLVIADFHGVRRGELVNYASHNDYRRGAVELDQMCVDGMVVKRADGKYQLGIPVIDEIVFVKPRMASEFFNLDRPDARALRRQRIILYGDDVLVSPDHAPSRPPYTSAGWPLDDGGILKVVARHEDYRLESPDSATEFWSDPDPNPDDELVSTPELTPSASFWA